jgi:hypothetical protein
MKIFCPDCAAIIEAKKKKAGDQSTSNMPYILQCTRCRKILLERMTPFDAWVTAA